MPEVIIFWAMLNMLTVWQWAQSPGCHKYYSNISEDPWMKVLNDTKLVNFSMEICAKVFSIFEWIWLLFSAYERSQLYEKYSQQLYPVSILPVLCQCYTLGWGRTRSMSTCATMCQCLSALGPLIRLPASSWGLRTRGLQFVCSAQWHGRGEWGGSHVTRSTTTGGALAWQCPHHWQMHDTVSCYCTIEVCVYYVSMARCTYMLYAEKIVEMIHAKDCISCISRKPALKLNLIVFCK